MNKPRRKRRQPQIQTVAIDWARIRERAASFADTWRGETSEAGESQSFWNDFFEIFGRNRRGLAFYQFYAERHSRQGELGGRMDMFWPGVLAVEHKSAGINLDDGEKQLFNYLDSLPDGERPRYALVCNFTHFRLMDIEAKSVCNFPLAELPGNVKRFGFFVQREEMRFMLELKASEDAVDLMQDIYDALRDSGYAKEVDRLLMRLLFCMFAEDTGIFGRDIFLEYLQKHTQEDGSDLGAHLEFIFDTLNKKFNDPRRKNLSTDLQKFPYINGDLFAEHIGTAAFDSGTREAILDACRFDWSEISPAIFGELFQSVRDSEERRASGEHYTSEENILKVICPLFLDGLEVEFERASKDKHALKKLHDKIADMRFLDPACGCGNFLIVAYRELRRLEMEILSLLHPDIRVLDIAALCRVDVDQFCGIEIGSFPAHIAQTAMWLTDHQMNREVSKVFGQSYARIPLTTAPHIVCGNALTMDWKKIIVPSELSCILGNPPFVGNYRKNDEQRSDLEYVFDDAKGAGVLDYVAAWYVKAARYIRGTDIRCAFVSTNSITQGDQVAPLWSMLYGEGIKIHFAHRTFRWDNEANGAAHVYVVIIGFSCRDVEGRTIYEYENIHGKPRPVSVANINAYLMDAPDILITARRKPLCNVPDMLRGSGPTDDGNFLFSDMEKKKFLRITPRAAPFFRPAVGGEEFLHGEKRWCLWLDGVESSAFHNIKPITERIQKVREFRKSSKAAVTRRDADSSHRFQSIRQPKTSYILVPRVSSENRDYIPMAFIKPEYIALDTCIMLPDGDLYHFGVLSSAMHMEWMRAVAGRLENRYRYSNTLVYNTFAWPEKITVAKKAKITQCAQAVLDARKNYPVSTLAELYSDKMPKDLERAHNALDKAVDRAYRSQPFSDERARLEFLFAEYAKLDAPVVPIPKKRKKKKQ